MTDGAIRSRLSETLGLDFEARDQGLNGTLFLDWDSERGEYVRLRITPECRADHESEIPAAVEEAITILRDDGGDVVIRNDEWGEITVVAESASPQK